MDPEDLNVSDANWDKAFINLPMSSLRPESSQGEINAQSHATLRLKILLDEDQLKYGLKIKYFSAAYKLWIDGREAVAVGQVGEARADFSASYLPTETFFSNQGEIVELVIQHANYHHRRSKLHSIILASEEQITDIAINRIIDNSIIFGALSFFAIFILFLYFVQGREKIILSLSALTAVIALRAGVVDERILVRLHPDMSGELISKLGYWPTFIMLPLLVIYVNHLFGGPNFRLASKVSKFLVIFFTAMIFVTDFPIYDMVFQYFQWFYFLMSFIFILIMIKDGFFTQFKIFAPMVLGLAFMLLAAINDYLRELNVIQTTNLLSLSFLVFIIIQTIFIAWRLNEAFLQVKKLSAENQEINQELLSLNEKLEGEVEARTRDLLAANQKLERMAKIDALTGIANRRAFDENYQEILKQATSKQEYISLLLMDLDYFKQYNDNYGHQAGDACLVEIAQTLKDIEAKTGNPVARFGGEEFVMLAYGMAKDEAINLARDIQTAINELKIKHEHSDVADYISISIGIASCQSDDPDQVREGLIGEADKALYHAKHSGRNQLVHFDDIKSN